MSMIKTEMAMLKAKKKSKIAAGKGTMIMASIQTMKATIVSDFAFKTGPIKGCKKGRTKSRVFLFAILKIYFLFSTAKHIS